METIKLWENVPGLCQFTPVLEYYPAEKQPMISKKIDCTVVIFPGGGYMHRAEHEGKGYAEFFNSIGMDAFVCQYRTVPHSFPLPLMDARRAVQYVRFNAEKYGISPDKIGVMGSSAGGHLAATVSTNYDDFSSSLEKPDEIDKVDFIPNFQILCYPVISFDDSFGHIGSKNNLLGDRKDDAELISHLCAEKNVSDKTPKAFIWHTFDDPVVNIKNSLTYATNFKDAGVDCEVHIYQNGAHGLGLAQQSNSVGQWPTQLKNWLIHNNYVEYHL